MKPLSNYRPRITAEITQEQNQILNRILPYGMKKPLFSVLVEGIIELHNKGGHEALGAIISKSISISQLSDFGLKKLKREKIEELEEKLERLKKEENARS